MRSGFWGITALLLAIGLGGMPATAVAKKKPKLSVQPASVTEGNSGITSISFAVKLSKKSKRDVTADYTTADGSATAPSDYAAEHGTVKIKKRKTTGEITVAVAGDAVVEPDETFLVVLSNPKRAKLATPSAQGRIINDDSDSGGGGGGGGGTPPTGADIQLAGVRATPATVRGGSPVDEQLTVTNNGPEAADGVSIAVTLPAGAAINATWTSPACAAGGAGATCAIGSLASGASQTVVVAATIPFATTAQNSSIQAVASASSPGDPVSGNASFVDSFSVPAGNATIATSTVSMPRDGATERKVEVAAGDAIADSYRETYGTDFGFATGGSIRSGVTCNVSTAGATYCPVTGGPPFAITRGGIVATLPFVNRIVTLSISGIELWSMLNTSVSMEPAAFFGFLQVSGLCFSWSQSAAVGARVQSVVRQNANGTCSATAIPPNSTEYTIAVTNSTADGTEGYPNLSSRATTRGYYTDVFTEWAIAHSPLNPVMGRITANP